MKRTISAIVFLLFSFICNCENTLQDSSYRDSNTCADITSITDMSSITDSSNSICPEVLTTKIEDCVSTENNNKLIIYGLIILVISTLAFAILLFILWKKLNSKTYGLGKTIAAMESSFRIIQENSIKTDNNLIKLLEEIATKTGPDHSLVLKIADEIVRIEVNLSRMDSSVKGHKQLSKAVERIKNNFLANGYEIVDMLGKPYDEGMKLIANFVPDETLKEGEQIITGITKPQINFNGSMIQSATITVSQNI